MQKKKGLLNFTEGSDPCCKDGSQWGWNLNGPWKKEEKEGQGILGSSWFHLHSGTCYGLTFLIRLIPLYKAESEVFLQSLPNTFPPAYSPCFPDSAFWACSSIFRQAFCSLVLIPTLPINWGSSSPWSLTVVLGPVWSYWAWLARSSHQIYSLQHKFCNTKGGPYPKRQAHQFQAWIFVATRV